MCKILIVDDSPDFRKVLQGALSDEGHTVRVAANEAEALDAVRQESFDFALFDMRLHEGGEDDESGLDLAIAVKSLDQWVHVVLLTRYVRTTQIIRATRFLDLNESDFIEKTPDIVERILKTITDAPERVAGEVNVQKFLESAGFMVEKVTGTQILHCEPRSSILKRLLPKAVYVRILPDIILDDSRVLTIRDEVQQIDSRASVVFVLTDRHPTDQGWAQIGTLRMGGFTLLPVDYTLLGEGLATGHACRLLRQEVEKRLGKDYDPYDVRDPVAGAFSFFGRDALVETILRRIGTGCSVGVFGLRKLGKSSLLRALRDKSPFPIATVNLQTAGAEALGELYLRILRYWRQWVHVHHEIKWEPPAITSGDWTGTFTTATLNLLNQIEDATGEARLGLFLDEVELITPRPDGGGPDLQRYLTFLRAIRGLIDEDGRLSLVVASLNPSINRINAWNGEQNPTFNLFQEIYLPPLTKEDCIQMVRNIGRQVGLVYEDESVALIAEYSGGHPFLARQLCSLLYKQRGRQPGQIEAAAIPAAVEHFIYDEQTVTHLDAGIWQDASNPTLWDETQAQINQTLLLELARADGPVPQDRLLDSPDADLRRTALINLERYHFIHQPELGYYALRFGLLRTWLRRRKLGLKE